MAFSITLSTAATKSAYQRFGDAYIAALTQAVPELDMAQCQSILSDVIGTVGRKAPKEKKAPKAKKSPKAASPSKRDLKKVELIGELKSYGEFAGEIPDVASVTIGAIRKQITAAKKAQKAAAKAAKAAKEAAKSPKKAKKAKKAKAAPGPSKRDLKKAELLTELTTLGGSLEEGKTLADYSVTDLRKMIKEVTPKKKKGRKAKKKAAEADHEALLATLASSLKAAENEPAASAAPAEKPKVTHEWVEPECTIASVTTFTGGANGEVIATKMTPNAAAPVVEEDKVEFDSSSDEAEESELELDSDSDSDSDSDDE